MILKKILKKKPEYPEFWAVVEVSDTAKDMFVKSDLCMVIKYFEGDKQVGQEAYSPHKVEMLTRRGIPVIYDDRNPASPFEGGWIGTAFANHVSYSN